MQYAVHTNNVILNEMFNQNVNGITTDWNGLFNVLNDEFSFDCHAFPEKIGRVVPQTFSRLAIVW